MESAGDEDRASTTPGPHHRVTLRNIDLLRFCAAGIVVLSHLPILYHHDGPGTASARTVLDSALSLLCCGPAAVMVFFIVSGICIHAPYAHGRRIDLRSFYIRRYVRIGGPLVIAYAVSVLLTGSTTGETIGLWSLCCEAIYYLLYPAMIWAMGRAGFLPVFMASVTAASGLLLLPDNFHGQAWAYGPWLTWIVFLPVWLAGVWIAGPGIAARPPAIFRTGPVIAAAAVGLIGFSAVTTVSQFHIHGGPPYKVSMLLFAVPAAAFVFALLSLDLRRNVICRYLDRQGAWSYSLYLVHPLAMLACLEFLHRAGGDRLIPDQPVVYGMLLASAWLTARSFHVAVEAPFHRLAKSWSVRLRPIRAATLQVGDIRNISRSRVRSSNRRP
jgi:peptidoglycan/LPS O-acetylase OafA/YrhL